MHRNKTKIRIGLRLSVMIFVLVLLCTSIVLAIPMPPNQFFGNVTIDGKPAPDGTVVSARIAGIEFAYTTTTINGKYGFDSAFFVPSDDLDTTEKEGGKDGDTVDFYVNTENESESAANAAFSTGGVTNLDLKIGNEPGNSAGIPGFLAPLTIAVLLAAAIFIALARRRKRK